MQRVLAIRRPPGLRARRCGRSVRTAALAVLLLLCGSGVPSAQAPPHVTGPPGSELPPPPQGSASLQGRILHAKDARGAAGLPVALYALRSDGTPGLAGTTSDAEGRFRFDGISSEPGIVYLLGTRYRDVPFGSRASFEPGQAVIEVDIPLSEIGEDASAVEVVETMLKLEWLGTGLLVDEVHHLRNPGQAVIRIAAERRDDREPVFRSRLPQGAGDFEDGQQGLGDGLERRGDALLHWGPVYPGDQEIRYRYVVQAPAREAGAAAPAAFPMRVPFPAGTGRVIVLRDEGAGRLSGPALTPASEPMEVDGRRYVRLDAGRIAAGGHLDLELTPPETSADAEALRVARADIWVDMDDTAMRVTVDLDLRVDGAAPVQAPPGESLMRAALPQGAEMLGLSSTARALGAVTNEAGELVVRGPVPPGRTTLGYRYRAPVGPDGARLELGFGRPVSLLNVLVADIGVAIASDRTHRQRPFREGTRLYLHEQAYQVAADERVSLGFRLLERRAITPGIALAGGLVGALAAAAFLAAPLRSRASAERAAGPAESPLTLERQGVYDSIRDLEHDHETGKVEDADYERMREELRREAVDLLRRERELVAATAQSEPAEPVRTGPAAFCTGCGAATLPSWRFCSRCGHALGTAPPDAG